MKGNAARVARDILVSRDDATDTSGSIAIKRFQNGATIYADDDDDKQLLWQIYNVFPRRQTIQTSFRIARPCLAADGITLLPSFYSLLHTTRISIFGCFCLSRWREIFQTRSLLIRHDSLTNTCSFYLLFP